MRFTLLPDSPSFCSLHAMGWVGAHSADQKQNSPSPLDADQPCPLPSPACFWLLRWQWLLCPWAPVHQGRDMPLCSSSEAHLLGDTQAGLGTFCTSVITRVHTHLLRVGLFHKQNNRTSNMPRKDMVYSRISVGVNT